MKINTSSYAISEVFSQLTFDNFDQLYMVTFFLKKMILAETWYEIYEGKLLAIIKTFKTWKYYLKECKYEVLILTD